jgi:hypothetical protein
MVKAVRKSGQCRYDWTMPHPHIRRRAVVLIPMILLAGMPAATVAAYPDLPFTVVETGAGYGRLQDAVDAIGDRAATVEIAAGRYAMCAVQAAGTITYRATVAGSVVFGGSACEGKAALVLRGRGARVEGVIFERMAVPDGNGAGIRLESGDLDVTNSVFRDSQQGILTGAIAGVSVSVDRSTFTRLGRCDGDADCAHSLYVGAVARLSVTRCRFEAGRGGHYVKSRARTVRIAANSFDDSQGHLTNYMIDLPNGAMGAVTDNEMVQGADKDNYSAFIALGAEGVEQPSAGLAITGNSAAFVPGVSRDSAFLADWIGEGVVFTANDLAAGIASYDRR